MAELGSLVKIALSSGQCAEGQQRVRQLSELHSQSHELLAGESFVSRTGTNMRWILDSDVMASQINNVAICYLQGGDFDSAERLAMEALDMDENQPATTLLEVRRRMKQTP